MNKYDNMMLVLAVAWLALAAAITYFGLRAGYLWWQVGLADYVSEFFLGFGICGTEELAMRETRGKQKQKCSIGKEAS